MNIKQASEQSGVSAPNIRFYEKEGLLTPARRQIGEMIKAGFWLNVISIIVIAGVCMALGDVLQLPMPK